MIRIRPRHLLLLIALAVISTNGQAQLYKWVDENGEVHFSDKAPDDEATSTVVPETTGNRVQYPGSEKATANPVIRPYDRNVHRLHLTDTRYIWKNRSRAGNSEKIGIYHVGRACTTRGAIRAPDVFLRHKSLLPNEPELTYHIMRTIKGLDYEAERSVRTRLQSRLQQTGGLSLHAEITAMDFKACAASVSESYRLKPVETIPPGRFTKNRVSLQVRWQLRDSRDTEVLFETTTSGEYDGWKQSKAPGQSIGSALESAVLALFSEQAFIDRLIDGKSAAPAQPGSTGNPVEPAANAFMMRAQATKALTEISPVRVHSIQYFMAQGKWPDDLSVLGLSQSMFDASDTIDYVGIDSDGSIVAELKALFGPGKTLTLQPQDDGSPAIRWRCISNLEQAQLPHNCRRQ